MKTLQRFEGFEILAYSQHLLGGLEDTTGI